jgi:hypothetical protein
MGRFIITLIAALFAVAGCGQAPAPAPSSGAAKSLVPAGGAEVLPSVQKSDKPEVTSERILRDVVGKVVPISELTGLGPTTEWTFDSDEFRQIDVLERRGEDDGLAIVIFMTTKNNPQPNEDSVAVSGKLLLHYQWRGNEWHLRDIENLSFRYSIGQAT